MKPPGCRSVALCRRCVVIEYKPLSKLIHKVFAKVEPQGSTLAEATLKCSIISRSVQSPRCIAFPPVIRKRSFFYDYRSCHVLMTLSAEDIAMEIVSTGLLRHYAHGRNLAWIDVGAYIQIGTIEPMQSVQ